MGSEDKSSGSGGRTIIRDAEHGKRSHERDQTQDAHSASPASGTVMFDGPLPSAGKASNSGTLFFSGSAPAAPSFGAAQTDDHRTTPASGKIPLDALTAADEAGNYASENPFLSAAAPLLSLFGRLRQSTVEAKQQQLAAHIADAIRVFDRQISQVDVLPADARIAKYALCETADDIVLNMPGIDKASWASSGMLARFFQTRVLGVGFFEALNTVLANPETHQDLLEFLHACLSLGFEGQYRAAGQRPNLERVRQDVYETLRYFKDRPNPDLSPHWRGLSEAMAERSWRLPIWAVAAGAAALVAGGVFAMRVAITDDGEAVAAELLALNPATPVTIERANYQPVREELPKPVTTQLERIRNALGQDIQAGNLAVQQKGDFIVVEINNALLFASGRAEVKPEFAPIAGRIASALDAERGPIRIVGHTDNVRPKKSGAFKSNYDLSVARAKAVETAVAPGIKERSRLAVEGKGEDEPIADNKTPEGRTKNRRVDLMIPREETL
jgi:type VI secretion system protein ImpK